MHFANGLRGIVGAGVGPMRCADRMGRVKSAKLQNKQYALQIKYLLALSFIGLEA
jgi:hypothetical protein